jgi:hypothetical protein
MVAALLSAGCGGERESKAANAASLVAASANTVAAEANMAPATPAAAPSAPVYTLDENGLSPGLGFGLAQARAVELATAAFGPPTARGSLDCPEGAMDTVNFSHLQLVFGDGHFAGWVLDGAVPRLQTAGGVGVGAPRNALGDVEISEERGFPEFSLGELSGVLDDSGARVVSLSAGNTCQFD